MGTSLSPDSARSILVSTLVLVFILALAPARPIVEISVRAIITAADKHQVAGTPALVAFRGVESAAAVVVIIAEGRPVVAASPARAEV